MSPVYRIFFFFFCGGFFFCGVGGGGDGGWREGERGEGGLTNERPGN